MTRVVVLSVVGLVAGMLATTGAQVRRDPMPHDPTALALPSVAGRDSFDGFCAACHGVDARGGGPAAAGMMPPPPDLTLLARRNGGAFPRDRIVAFVLGVEPRSGHETTEMPDWGPILHGLDPSNVREQQRINNVVAYIESLQVPSSGPDDPGARLFRAYCATCHGDNGRGMGPVAQQWHPMPDLTELSNRNGGVFPSAKVARIVDGRDIDAHGSPEMPVWGSVFRRDSADVYAAQSRIDAIVKYLSAIQRRAG